MRKVTLYILAMLFAAACVLLPGTAGAAGKQENAIIAVSAGFDHALALRSDGTVWSWGANDWGQLGNGTLIRSLAAKQVAGLTGIKAVAAGKQYSMALDAEGSVWVWGYYNQTARVEKNQIKDKEGVLSLKPVKLKFAVNMISIAAGETHGIMLDNRFRVLAWGDNSFHQTLPGSTSATTDTPSVIADLVTYANVLVAAGATHSIAADLKGNVRVWGTYAGGFSEKPEIVGTFDSLKKVIAGFGEKRKEYPGEDTYVIDRDSRLIRLNAEDGQEEIAASVIDAAASKSRLVVLHADKTVSLRAPGQQAVPISGLEQSEKIAFGNDTLIAVKRDGTIWSVSMNESNTSYLQPQQVRGFEETGAGASYFTDMKGHWAEQAVNRLAELHVVDGNADGSFRPDAQVTRGQFLKILVLSNPEKLKTDIEKQTFQDVPLTHWASPYVESAVSSGIIDKDDYGDLLEPNKIMTRLDMAVMVGNAVGGFHGATLKDSFADYADIENGLAELLRLKDRKNAEEIRRNATARLNHLLDSGIIEGFPDRTFRPKDTLTKAQACAVVLKLIK